MVYNSINFIVLFPLIFLLYYVIPARYGKARNLFLLVVSYLLYMQWKPVYALILMGVTVVTYWAALRLNGTRRSRAVVTAGVLLALLPLVLFKYFNFINDSLSEALSLAGLHFQLPGLNWAVPIGIAFLICHKYGKG